MSKSLLIILISMLNLSCGKNALSEMAKKDDPAAIEFEAYRLLNDQDYTGALNKIAELPTDTQAKREIQFLKASAYAGRCGLNFVSTVLALTQMGSSTLFTLLMRTYQNSTASTINDCISAESTITGVASAAANRTTDENLLMAFVSLSKIGAVLNTYADTDHSGTVDAGFDQCSNAVFPDAQVRQVGTGIAHLYLSLSQAGTSVGGGSLASVLTSCASYPFCSNTDPSSYTAAEVKAIRTFTAAQDDGSGGTLLGVGDCASSPATLANCVCP